MPLTAALALLGFMQITGIPPSLGLWSEVLIVFGAVGRAKDLGSVAFILLVIGLLVAIGLSTTYAFITMKRIFFGQPSPDQPKGEGLEINKTILIPIIIIAAVGILLFFFPQIFIDPLTKFFTPFTG
jgi:NADH-quinone oxidoreductase subunit M